MCKSLNVAVNKCINWCFVHLLLIRNDSNNVKCLSLFTVIEALTCSSRGISAIPVQLRRLLVSFTTAVLSITSLIRSHNLTILIRGVNSPNDQKSFNKSARPQGQQLQTQRVKIWSQRPKVGWSFWEGGLQPPPHQLGSSGECHSSPSGVCDRKHILKESILQKMHLQAKNTVNCWMNQI